MVHVDVNGYYTFDQPNPWVLIKALQEQQDEISELKQTIQLMKQTMQK